VRETTLVITGKYQGSQRAFEYPVSINPGRQVSVYSFVERLWATRRVGYLLDQIQLHGKSEEVVDEIVQLSRDYGIITPYTSFLADERTDLAAEAGLRLRARRSAEPLAASFKGGRGQTDAMNRQAYNEALRPAPQSAAVPVDRAGRRRKAPGLSGFGYRGVKEYEAGEKDFYTSVQNVGNQTLYRRGRTWMTPENAKLDRVRDKNRIKVIQRYSDEYFALVRANTVAQNQVLASQAPEEELLVTFRSQVYLIQ
jgi:Ca-activated chloride channel family protein